MLVTFFELQKASSNCSQKCTQKKREKESCPCYFSEDCFLLCHSYSHIKCKTASQPVTLGTTYRALRKYWPTLNFSTFCFVTNWNSNGPFPIWSTPNAQDFEGAKHKQICHLLETCSFHSQYCDESPFAAVRAASPLEFVSIKCFW